MASPSHPASGIVRLMDIARRAGVSVYTVSCALRGMDCVAPDTAARIRQIAEEMGYRPNAAARLLARARRRAHSEERNPAVAVVRFGATVSPESEQEDRLMREIASRQGFWLDIVRLTDFSSPADLSRVLWARGTEGVVFLTRSTPPGFRLKDLEGFEWHRFAYVKISRGFDELRCHTVRVSVFLQMLYALERIASAGYRRLLVLLFHPSASRYDDWARLGAVEAFRHLRSDTFEHMCIRRLQRLDLSPNELLRIVRGARPDVILGFPFVWRLRLEMAGIRIPDDVAFVGVPTISDSAGEVGRPTSGPLDDFGGQEFPAALHMLEEEIAAGRRGLPAYPYEHVVPVVWQNGVTFPEPAPTRKRISA